MADMVLKGRRKGKRSHRGESSPHARLTMAKAVEIKYLLSIRVNEYVIASMFGVRRANISKIKLGKRWSHVPYNPPMFIRRSRTKAA